MNLSYSLVKRGWRVLLIDADPQGGVGSSLTEKSKDAVGCYDFLVGESPCEAGPVDDAVIRTRLPGFALLPRGTRESMDRLLERDRDPGDRLSELHGLLTALRYDLLLYDTPTGFHGVTLGLCREIDHLLIPQQPCPLCLRSLPQLLRTVAAVKSFDGGGPGLAGFLLSMTDPEDPSNLDDQREFRDLLPVEMVMETVIPRHDDLVEASRRGIPVAMLRQRPSASALIFDQLAAEVEERLKLREKDEGMQGERDEYARLVD